jgi:hypothetical protein
MRSRRPKIQGWSPCTSAQLRRLRSLRSRPSHRQWGAPLRRGQLLVGVLRQCRQELVQQHEVRRLRAVAQWHRLQPFTARSLRGGRARWVRQKPNRIGRVPGFARCCALERAASIARGRVPGGVAGARSAAGRRGKSGTAGGGRAGAGARSARARSGAAGKVPSMRVRGRDRQNRAPICCVDVYTRNFSSRDYTLLFCPCGSSFNIF